MVQSHKENIHKNAVETTFHTMNLARSLASTMQRDITVSIDEENFWCIGLSDNGKCNCKLENACSINGEERVVSGRSFPEILISNINFNGNNHAVFQAKHEVSDIEKTTGFLIFEQGDNKIRLEKKVPNRVHVCLLDGNLPGYSVCNEFTNI